MLIYKQGCRLWVNRNRESLGVRLWNRVGDLYREVKGAGSWIIWYL